MPQSVPKLKDKPRICPLLTAFGKIASEFCVDVRCVEAKCSWWVDDYEACAFVVQATRFLDVEVHQPVESYQS